MFFFFFSSRRRHTRCSRDWSSDVCSSDLVRWPSLKLLEMSLLDTPGLEGKDAEASRRSRLVLGLDDASEVQVDAVIYLMRHLHAKDVDFLEAFLEQSISRPSPISSLAVISRADEVGAGRADALASAATIAERYKRDPRISRFCANVLPVAGLLAEAGAALQEEEASGLRALATLSTPDLEQLLLSVDRVAESPLSTVATDVRHALLRRLGLFGVRLCVNALHAGDVLTAQDLARLLTKTSGIEQLRGVIADRFSRHAALLKARSALTGLKEALRTWHQLDASAARDLEERIERIESSSAVLSALRLTYLSPLADDLDDEERAEILSLVDECARSEATVVGDSTERSLIVERIAYWRYRSEDPIASPEILEIAQTAARLYEALAATSTSHPVTAN